MIWLMMALGSLAVAYGALLRLTILQRRALREAETATHAKCIAHIASVTSARVIAITLRDLAEKWGTIENQAELKRLVREQWIEDGPSIPALWLYEKARLIEEEGK